MQLQMQTRAAARNAFPSNISDGERGFVAPYLALVREDAGQRAHNLRKVFNAVRYVARTGVPWGWLPGDFPRGRPSTSRASAGSRPRSSRPWCATSTRLRIAEERAPGPSAVVLDSTTDGGATTTLRRLSNI